LCGIVDTLLKMKATSLLSVSILARAVAGIYGPNGTFMSCGDAGGYAELVNLTIPQLTPSDSTFEGLNSPAGYDIKSHARAGNYHRSQHPLQSTVSSGRSLPASRLPLVKSRTAHTADWEADSQPNNIPLLEGIPKLKPWEPLYGSSGYTSNSGNEDDNDLPPKPPFSTSLGKRRWDASFDADNEEGTPRSEGDWINSHSSFMANLNLSELWLRHLRSAVNAAPEVEEPEYRSASHSGNIAALAGAAFCLGTTQSLDKRRKKQKTPQGESSASGGRRAPSRATPFTSNAYNQCVPSTSEVGGALSGKMPQYLENPDSTLKWGNCSNIIHSATRPLSQEDLVAEVKRIYADLVMVKGKCTAVDSKYEREYNAWKALIEQHRLLLREHHDLFILGPQKTSYEGSIDTDSDLSNPPSDYLECDNFDILADKSPLESPLSLFCHELSGSFVTPESATATYTTLSFDIDENLKSQGEPFLETAQVNTPVISKPLENASNIESDLGLEPDEEWLRSFVDLEMCSDDSSDFIPETTSHNRFLCQPELLILPAPKRFNEVTSYVEPCLILMKAGNQTTERQQELQASFLSSPNPYMEELKSLMSLPVPSTPTSRPSGLPLAPSKVEVHSRKGALRECNYCHKLFSPGELK
jgi:hypothetical protein